jgi:hypothetical protein
MQPEEPQSLQVRQGEHLTPVARDRLVELLAVGLERFLREGHADPASLTSSADLCLYDARADDAAADDA